MQIYLLRHGIAEDAPAGMRDADRALTPDGRKKLKSVLEKAAASGMSPTLVLSSPYRRAMQTAEVAVEVLGHKEPILTTRALEPGSDAESVWDEIRVHKDQAQVLLTGHEPLFSALAAYLLNAPSLCVDFKKGALMRVDLDPVGRVPRGVLRWMLTAKLT